MQLYLFLIEVILRIVFLHNILWSRYRVNLFNHIASASGLSHTFFVLQVAETEKNRILINQPSRFNICHDYKLLFEGCYDDISSPAKCFSLTRFFIKYKADLIVVTGYASFESWFALFWAKVFRKKIVLTVDSSDYEYSYSYLVTFLKRFFIKSVDSILVYGSSSSSLVQRLGGDLSKVFQPFHCVESNYYDIPENILRQKKAMYSDRFEFLFVGRLSIEKGLEDLINSFYKSFGHNEHVCLRIVGDGPFRDRLREFIAKRCISNIFIDGPLSGYDLFRAYLNANCCVLPSTVEPWGLVVNEALCSGTPVVVSDRCGCVPDLIDGNSNAIKFTSSDRIDLERALSEAYVRFKYLDEEAIRRCIDFGQSYSPVRAVNAFFKAIDATRE
jgi:glycosyltransferase involved in cell wall biosynthesis